MKFHVSIAIVMALIVAVEMKPYGFGQNGFGFGGRSEGPFGYGGFQNGRAVHGYGPKGFGLSGMFPNKENEPVYGGFGLGLGESGLGFGGGLKGPKTNFGGGFDLNWRKKR